MPNILPTTRLDSLIDPDTLNAFCSKLKILANPQRFKILLLLNQGEAAVGEIESRTGIKQPNLSLELRKLRDNAIVQTRKQSKVVFYSLSDELTQRLIESLALQMNSNPGSDSQMPNAPRLGNRVNFQFETGRRGECAHFSSIQKNRTL